MASIPFDFQLIPQPHHAVRFYEDEQYLYEMVGDFLAEGLAAGEPAVVIATPAHRDGFFAQLGEKGIDHRDPRLVFVNAHEALATFMGETNPDEDRFTSTIGGLIEKLGRSHPRIRAYGEMVDLLWRDGKPHAAIRLEELWNDLGRMYEFSLLCAYPIANFYRETDLALFDKMCERHTHVTPAERYSNAGNDDARAREIARLQQRATALEAEVAMRKKIEKTLRETIDDNMRLYHVAQDANRAKDRFLATLSHELRTPLTAILGWARMLNLGDIDADTTRMALDTIERNARTQASLIDDLLDLSKIVTGKMSLETELVDLNSVVANVVQTVRLAADTKGIAIDVSSTNERIVVTGDATRLQQIVWNLLSNAIKFSESGSSIAVSLDRSGGKARVTVRDHGRGIAADFLSHVFDPFRQADNGHTRAFGGLGLGLAIVKYLAELHGGSVTASSEGLGLGASFTVTLPLAAHQYMRAEATRPIAVDLKGTRVLVVDDDDGTRSLAGAVLLRCGAEVIVVDSAEQAHAALHENHFDVLVTDISMPDEDGFTLLRRVRIEGNGYRDIPIVALTAVADAHTEERLRKAGFCAYVRKPVDPLRFAQVIVDVRPK